MSPTRAEDLTFNGNGTVRILASDWAAYLGGSSTFDAGVNDGGRLFWRGAGDGQYIHFDLSRLQGLTMQSTANVTLQNTDATYGGGVDGSFIATANGAWTAASGAALPGATAISDATNATGSYGSGTSISWGIGSSTFQSYVNNASSFNGLAIIGGNGSQMHFGSPMNPYLTVTTNAAMNGVVTVSGGAAWNSNSYSFTNGVLTLNDAVVGDNFGAGNVTINALGTVFANGNYNKYWAVDSTRINTGGVLLGYGHSHLRNLTLAGGELAGIRPDGTYGTWMFDDATTVTGGVTSTISAQQVWLNNGNFTIDAGSTLNFTGSVKSGAITPTIGAGGRLVYGGAAGSATTLGAVTLNGGELAATSTPSSVLGNYVLSDTVTVGGSSMSTISADVRVINNQDRTFNVANADGGSGVDLLVSGKLGHYNNVSGGSFTKTGAGTMKISGATEVYRGTVNEGRLILEDNAIEGWWGGGLVNNAAVEFSVSGSKSVSYGLSGSGSLTKTGVGTLALSGGKSYSGGTTVNAGTLTAVRGSLGNSGAVVVNNGGVLVANDQWVFSGVNAFNVNEGNASSLTVNAGGEFRLDATQGFANGITDLYLNGGSVTGGNNDIGFGALYMFNGNERITAGGAAASTIGVSVALTGNNNTITVDGGSTLAMTQVIRGSNWFGFVERGGFVKAGNGTLTLSGANTYSGVTDVTGGTLVAASNSALGSGGLDGATMTWVRNGATLGLQGTISTDEHLHVVGTGVGGLGAIRNVSGDNTMTNWIALDGNTTVGVDAGTLNLTNKLYGDGDYNASSLTKVGAGTLVLGGNNVLTGGLIVDGGTVIANKSPQDFGGDSSLGNGPVTVNNGGTLRSTVNWTTGSPWVSQRVGAVTINNGGTWSIEGLGQMVNNGLYLNGGTISGSIENADWGGLLINSSVTAGGNAVSTVSVDTALVWGQTFTVDAGSQLTYSGKIHNHYQGGGAITKAGAGTLVLSGPNTYTGQTDITAGTLVAANNTALGTGGHDGGTMSFIRDGATLALQGGVSLDEHFHVWGAGVGGLGAVRSISGNNALTNSPGGGPGFALRANTTVGVDADTLTVSGFYESEGNWGLTKVGAGTLQLTAESSYTGGTTVNAGTLLLPGNGGRGRISGALTVNAGGIVETTGDGTGLGYQDQISSLAINGGTVTAAGTMHVWNIPGGVTMTGGTLQSNDGVSSSGGNALVWNRTSVTTNASASTATIGGRIWMRNDNGYSGIPFTVADGAAPTDLLVSAAITESAGGMGITKSGAGTMALSGNNSYSGATSLLGGTLRLESTSALGSGVLGMADGTMLQLRSDSSATFTGGNGLGGLGGASITIDVNQLTSGASGQTLSFAPGGFNTANTTVNVTGGNGYSLALGGINEGFNASLTLNAVSANLQIGAIGSSSAVSSLTVGGASDTTISGAVATFGGLSKSGAGTLYLNAASSYTGGTTLNAGRLVAGNAAAFGSGGVTVGSGATLDLGGYAVANTITNNGGSILNASSYAGTQAVVGVTTFTGTVGGNVTVDAGGTLKGSNTTFTGAVAIADGGSHSPGNSPGTQTFASGLAYSGSSSLTWELIANTTSGPGTNYDFLSVTGGDLTIASGALLNLEFLNTGTAASSVNWANAFWDTAHTWTIIDFTSSGSSTGIFTLAGDPSTWLDSGSTSLASARPDASFSVGNVNGDVVLTYAIVPEPSSIALAGLGGLLAAVALRRRRA